MKQRCGTGSLIKTTNTDINFPVPRENLQEYHASGG